MAGEQLAWQVAPAADRDPSDETAQNAAAVLGWAGIVLPELSVFGCRLLPVIVPDVEAHRARQRDGDGPELDGDTLSVWEWPESQAPAPAVRLSGALFPARRGFRRALGDARRWRPFGPAAVLAPAAIVADQVFRWDCALHGVGLAASDRAALIPAGATVCEVVLPEAGRRAPARRRTADRWIEESLYALALDAGVFPATPQA